MSEKAKKMKSVAEIQSMIDGIRGEEYEGIAVPDLYVVDGVLDIPNGCCWGMPVLLTRKAYARCNEYYDREEAETYSCQCVCGHMITGERYTPAQAINEYMTRSNEARARKELGEFCEDGKAELPF